MLPRLSSTATTTQSSSDSTTDTDSKRRGFLRAVPPRADAEPQPTPLPPEPPPDGESAEKNPSLAHPPAPLRPRSFGHIVQQLMGQLKSLPFVKWIGVGAYQATMKLGKKSGRIRKGALVDRKAE